MPKYLSMSLSLSFADDTTVTVEGKKRIRIN